MSGAPVLFPQIVQPHPGFAPAPLDVYANQVRLGATIHDFTLVFGTTEDTGVGQVTNRDRVVVRLAPTTLKLLQVSLTAAIESYEEAIGTIPVPEKLAAEVLAVKEKVIAAYNEQMHSATPISTHVVPRP